MVTDGTEVLVKGTRKSIRKLWLWVWVALACAVLSVVGPVSVVDVVFIAAFGWFIYDDLRAIRAYKRGLAALESGEVSQ